MLQLVSTFSDRRGLHDRGVHRGLMRGIAPAGSSIVLSGGYPDDEDFGDRVIYTGEGGCDPDWLLKGRRHFHDG